MIDVLAGVVPPGGDRSFQPDGRAVPDGEFEVLALTRHDLDVADNDAVHRAVAAARVRMSSCTWRPIPRSIAPQVDESPRVSP
jgi:hypothetical protein